MSLARHSEYFSPTDSSALLLMVPDLSVDAPTERQQFLTDLEESYRKLVAGDADHDFLLLNTEIFLMGLEKDHKYIIIAEDVSVEDLDEWNVKINEVRDSGGVLAIPFLVRAVQITT